MKKITFCLFLAALCCAAVPAAAQKAQTDPYSGVAHQAGLPPEVKTPAKRTDLSRKVLRKWLVTTGSTPWAYEVYASTKNADLSRKVRAWLVTVGYDAKIGNNSVFETAKQIKQFPKTVKESNFKRFMADSAKSAHKDLMRSRFSQLQKALDKSEVFAGYSLNAQTNEDFATLSEADFEYMKRFFAAPAKARTPDMNPQQAFLFKTGAIYLTLLNQETRAFNPIFLILNPEDKTVTFIYNHPVFDRTLLKGNPENLLED